jgi:hypothetical protein
MGLLFQPYLNELATKEPAIVGNQRERVWQQKYYQPYQQLGYILKL